MLVLESTEVVAVVVDYPFVPLELNCMNYMVVHRYPGEASVIALDLNTHAVVHEPVLF